MGGQNGGASRAWTLLSLDPKGSQNSAAAMLKSSAGRVTALSRLTSRLAGYAIRTSGGQGGGPREGTPYPDLRPFFMPGRVRRTDSVTVDYAGD